MEPTVAKLLNVRQLVLREKIGQQRQTIKALKQAGHECPDAQRQLKQMLAEVNAGKKSIKA